jgi:hypothetical protein
MDVAALNLAVKFDQVQGATAALKEQTKAASASERAAQKWGMATKEAGRSSDDFSKRVQRTIRDLEFERQQLMRNAAEQARYTALRRAGVTATSAEGQAISASVAALQAQRAARDAENKSLERRQIILARVNGAALALGAAIGGALALRQFITETIDAEREQAQLAATLRSTGAAAGQSIESLNDHAMALSRLTAFEDGAINGAQALLLTFTQIRGDTFPKATEAVLNMATAMNTDLKSAALQVGKALNDPVAGVSALARAGIQFTESQKQAIKSLVDSGRMTEAQTLVLKELETQFGGSAKAARETLGGALLGLRGAWVSLFTVAGPASDALRLGIEDLTSAISDPRFDAFVKTIGALLFGAFGLAARGVTVMIGGIGQLVDGFIWLDDKVYKTANLIIGAFVAAYEDVKTVWSNFGDIIGAAVIGGVNAAIRGINALVQGAADGIDKVIDLANKIPGVNIGKIGQVNAIGEMANPSAARLAGTIGDRNAAVNAAMSRDYLGRSDRATMDAASAFYGSETGRTRTPPPPAAEGAGAKGGSDPYAKAIESAREYVLSKKAETEAVGQTVLAAAQLKHQQDLLNKATGEGKTLSDAQKAALQSLAGQMAEADNALAKAKFSDDARTKSEEFLAQQEMERQALFMSAQAADALRMSTEMLNAAKRQGIELSPAEVEAIKASADAMAASRAQTDQMKQVVNLGREVFKGFFSDMREGLMNGKSVWESFGNAAVNALNRIAEKLIEMAATQLFEAAFPSGGGAGGGGGLGGLIGGLFGSGGGGGAAAGIEASWAGLSGAWGFANGAAFRAGNVIPFASGGIVGSPTMFPMSGNRRGLMGEAGPEAIMPLRRGPGGRLGVEAANGNGQQPVIVHLTGDTDLVRVAATGAAVQVYNAREPGTVGKAVKRAGEQAPAAMARHERERAGAEWRT